MQLRDVREVLGSISWSLELAGVTHGSFLSREPERGFSLSRSARSQAAKTRRERLAS